MLSRQATQACLPCRKLKRKCTRELPTCSVCSRLSKPCVYPPKVHGVDSRNGGSPSQRVDGSEQQLENGLTLGIRHGIGGSPRSDSARQTPRLASGALDVRRTSFPVAFFLDSTSHRQLSAERRDSRMPVAIEVLDVLQSSADMRSLCEAFFLSAHSWLPILSQKRVLQKVNDFDPGADTGLALLMLCMKLVSGVPPEGDQPATSALYSLAKGLYYRVENNCLISLQLVQSAILIAVYEIGHGIYPAGYLSIGHAARLGIMIGLHDKKNAAQLFKGGETWSQCEEELRAWWAIIILDRYVNLGVSGFPLATPEPLQGALLPCAESTWNQGEFGCNEPLFVSSFANNTEVGSFAKTCQASHVLGLILRHRDDRTDNSIDMQFRLSEAKQLHLTLVALNRHLTIDGSNTDVAAALCYSARIILYDLYACNEHYAAGRPRLPDEAVMQRASMEGLKEVTQGVYQLAQKTLGVAAATNGLLLSKSLLVCHCLYQASSECAWFIREDKRVEEVACLKAMVMLLRAIGKRWRIAEEYVKSLDAEGDLASIVE